jgi:uncharacterized protein
MFEYDPEKSAANLAKHGIDFEQAQALWDDEGRAEVLSFRGAEVRWLLMGKIDDQHWTAVYTVREANIRNISVRRSRANEVKDYDSRKDN